MLCRSHTVQSRVAARLEAGGIPMLYLGDLFERPGDYALVLDGAVVAVVERKTFDGLLAEFGRMDVLRQRLLELSE